ncbi:chromosome segregation protein [Candidatus Brocadiaceae bacterium B188]|nr:hypothetical protein [Candidatus Brocadia sapporoensis]QQR66264.1 MAG: hypothetical protein IPI25_12195 [Candidatus Brocadia sp.]RZV58576.1 MAG: hypothetical protein EX330_04470 [Candidatus Brocadia sp. BROELEC01]TWU53217.1 chromosome segregation protein [Candidatus Brocadiaceae bacterium B188]
MTGTTINEKTSPLTPEARKGSYLDRGFPMVKILLGILVVVFILQSLSAWKIMNLEREKASFEAEKQNFILLKEQLPELRKIISDLEGNKSGLQGEINTLKNDIYNLEVKRSQVVEDVKINEQKLSKLKSDNESYEYKLQTSENLLKERKKACDDSLALQKKLKDDADSLETKITMCNSEINTLQEKVVKLQDEEKSFKAKVDRLAIRENELQKLNTDFSNVIANLKSGSTEFTQYQSEVKVSLKSASNMLEDTTKTMRGSIAKIDNEVPNLKNSIDGFNQKQMVMTEIQNKFETAITKVENSAEGLSAGKLNIAAQTLDDATKDMRNSVANIDQEVTNLKRSSIDLKNGVDQSTNNLKVSVGQLSNVSTQSGTLLEGLSKELNSFQQKQVAMVEAQNKFEILLKQIESSAKDFNTDKLGLQDTYKKLKEETLNEMRK